MKNEINEFSTHDFKIRNFKSNVKLRLPNAVNKIDYNALYNVAFNILSKKDATFNMLSDLSKITFVNNVLIFSLTDMVIAMYNSDSTVSIEDEIYKNILTSTNYRINNLYPTEHRFNFLDVYNRDIV
jgi:hypothetical protein